MPMYQALKQWLSGLGVILALTQPTQAFEWPTNSLPLAVPENFFGEVWVEAEVGPRNEPSNYVWTQCNAVLRSYIGNYTAEQLLSCYNQVVAVSPNISSRDQFDRLRPGSLISLPLTRTQVVEYQANESLDTFVTTSVLGEQLEALREDMAVLESQLGNGVTPAELTRLERVILATLDERLTQQANAIDGNQAALAEQAVTITSLENELMTTSEQLRDRDGELAEGLAALEEQDEALIARSQSLVSDVETIESSLNKQGEAIDGLRNNLSNTSEQLRDRDGELAEGLAALKEQDSELLARDQSLQDDVNAVKEDFAAVRNDIDDRFERLGESINAAPTEENLSAIRNDINDRFERLGESLSTEVEESINSALYWWNTLWSWALLLLLILLTAGLLAAMWWRLRRDHSSLSEKTDQIEMRQAEVERDTRELYTASFLDETGVEVTEDVLNDKRLEHDPLVLDAKTAPGKSGAAVPRVNVFRSCKDDGQPFLKIVGAEPGENLVHASKRNGQWWFKLGPFHKRWRTLVREGKIVGLKKARDNAV